MTDALPSLDIGQGGDILCLLPGKRKGGRQIRLRVTFSIHFYFSKSCLCLNPVEPQSRRPCLSRLHPQPVHSGLRGSETKAFFQSRSLRVGGQPPKASPGGPTPRSLSSPAGRLLSFPFQQSGSCPRAAPGLSAAVRTRTGADDKAAAASDPDHLDGDTGTPSPLPVLCGLPPEAESAIGAPHLPFSEASGIHTDTAEDILGKKKRLALERPKLRD